jgi:hypothetical protein
MPGVVSLPTFGPQAALREALTMAPRGKTPVGRSYAARLAPYHGAQG